MNEKESDLYFGIDPRFTHNRGGPEDPNSGPEHNPVLERKFPLLSELPDINQPEREDLHSE